jgi:hypothetical protein
MPINQPSGEPTNEGAADIPKDIIRRAKWSIAQMDTIFEREAEERRRIEGDATLSDAERKQGMEAIRNAERLEIAALFDRLGIISTESKVRGIQQLQGQVKPRKAA